jgi:hypothetical protein
MPRKEHKREVPPQGEVGREVGTPPREGGREFEALPRKGERKIDALPQSPIEGEYEPDWLPREVSREGTLSTWEGATPSNRKMNWRAHFRVEKACRGQQQRQGGY